jgi:hypothetical protein
MSYILIDLHIYKIILTLLTIGVEKGMNLKSL